MSGLDASKPHVVMTIRTKLNIILLKTFLDSSQSVKIPHRFEETRMKLALERATSPVILCCIEYDSENHKANSLPDPIAMLTSAAARACMN